MRREAVNIKRALKKLRKLDGVSIELRLAQRRVGKTHPPMVIEDPRVWQLHEMLLSSRQKDALRLQRTKYRLWYYIRKNLPRGIWIKYGQTLGIQLGRSAIWYHPWSDNMPIGIDHRCKVLVEEGQRFTY